MPSLETLQAWRIATPGLTPFLLDYHRLQVEHFIWHGVGGAACPPARRVLDIGVEYRKPYLRHLGANYITLNEDDPTTAEWAWKLPDMDKPDVLGDICALPFPDADFDFVLCTEVLEHIADPWLAVREIRRVLKPGGAALMTSPFMWPWHGSTRYADFWRFTADGWRQLCRDFAAVRVFPQEFHPESPLPDLMAIEKMGSMSSGRPATGYAVRATR